MARQRLMDLARELALALVSELLIVQEFPLHLLLGGFLLNVRHQRRLVRMPELAMAVEQKRILMPPLHLILAFQIHRRLRIEDRQIGAKFLLFPMVFSVMLQESPYASSCLL